MNELSTKHYAREFAVIWTWNKITTCLKRAINLLRTATLRSKENCNRYPKSSESLFKWGRYLVPFRQVYREDLTHFAAFELSLKNKQNSNCQDWTRKASEIRETESQQAESVQCAQQRNTRRCCEGKMRCTLWCSWWLVKIMENIARS